MSQSKSRNNSPPRINTGLSEHEKTKFKSRSGRKNLSFGGLVFDNDLQRWQSPNSKNSSRFSQKKSSISPYVKGTPGRKRVYTWHEQVDLDQTSQSIQHWRKQANTVLNHLRESDIRAMPEHTSKGSVLKVAQIILIILTQKDTALQNPWIQFKSHTRDA